MKHNPTDSPVIAEKDKNIPDKRLFISLTTDWPYWTEGQYVVLSCDLLTDVVYEIGSELAFMVKEHDIPDKHALLFDFKAERPEEYAKIADQIQTKLISSFFAAEIPDEVDFSFPESYVDWLCYSTNQDRAAIGRKLRDKNASITLSPVDIYDEYIKEGVLEKITRLIKNEPTITIYSVVNTKIAEGPFFNSIKEANPNICYKPFSEAWITFELGYMHGNGIGGEKNLFKALGFYCKAADLGSAFGARNAGSYYANGTGVQVDQTKAFEYYLLAANRNYSKAFGEVGNRYHNGNGVEKDLKKAVEWYVKALPQKQPWVYRCLAQIYREGKDVEQNLPEALRLYQFAADNGDKWAQQAAGDMLVKGEGTEADEEKGFEYLKKAADAKLGYAIKLCGDLAANGVGEFGRIPKLEEPLKYYDQLKEGPILSAQFLVTFPLTEDNASQIFDKLAEYSEKDNNVRYLYIKYIYEHQDMAARFDKRMNGRAELSDIVKLLEYAANKKNTPAATLLIQIKAAIEDIERRKAEELERKQNEQNEYISKISIACEGANIVDIYNENISPQLVNYANKGIPRAMAQLGFALLKYNPECKEAAQLVIKSVEGTDNAVLFYKELAETYDKLDLQSRERVWFSKEPFQKWSNSRGVTPDCYIPLAIMYMSGTGVAKNETKAISLLEKAIDAGCGVALLIMGICHEKGIGVSESFDEAINYYERCYEINEFSKESGLAEYLKARLIERMSHSSNDELVELYNGGDVRSDLKLVDLKLRQGNKTGAIRHLHRVLTHLPGRNLIDRNAIVDYAIMKYKELNESYPKYREKGAREFSPYPAVYFNKKGISLEKPTEEEYIKCDCIESNRAVKLFDVITAAPFYEEPEYVQMQKEKVFDKMADMSFEEMEEADKKARENLKSFANPEGETAESEESQGDFDDGEGFFKRLFKRRKK